MKFTCGLDDVKLLETGTLKQVLEKDTSGDFVLVDVRQPEEYGAGHIPGARSIPLGELEARSGELEKNRRIITYCRTGHRSIAAAVLLHGMGFGEVSIMDGGILNWEHEIMTVRPQKIPGIITGMEDIQDILMIALKFEKGSMEFYLQALDRVGYLEAKEAFQHLARLEEHHMRWVYDRYDELDGRNELPAFEQLKDELDPEHMEGGIEINEMLLKMGDMEFRDWMEVLEVAIEKEYHSYDFYKRAAFLMEEDDIRALLHQLAGEERSHIDHLTDEIRATVKGEYQ